MNIKGRTLFDMLFVLIFAVGFYFSAKWNMKARLFPQLIVLSGLVVSIHNLIKTAISNRARDNDDGKPMQSGAVTVPSARPTAAPKSEWTMILWVGIYFCMIILFGFWVTIILYTVFFMSIFGRENWKIVTIYTVGIWLLIYFGLSVGMSASLYGGVLGLTW